MEADLYPRRNPDLSNEIEGSIGRYTHFDQTFGYFADGVGPETATVPPGWEDRLIPVCNENTGGATGWCLEPHDLAFSKLAARREKDLHFVGALLKFKLIRPSTLERLFETVDDNSLREWVRAAYEICQRYKV